MADDTATAVRANRRQCVDCALEAIKGVTLSAHDDFKRLVIIVLADFAFRHTQFVRARGGSRRCLINVAKKFDRSGRHHRCRLQLRAPEIILVLNDAESYHWSPSLRVGAVVHANTRCHRDRCPTIAETLAKFGADEKTGLTDVEVQARLQKYGPNALVEKQKNTFAALLAILLGTHSVDDRGRGIDGVHRR